MTKLINGISKRTNLCRDRLPTKDSPFLHSHRNKVPAQYLVRLKMESLLGRVSSFAT